MSKYSKSVSAWFYTAGIVAAVLSGQYFAPALLLAATYWAFVNPLHSGGLNIKLQIAKLTTLLIASAPALVIGSFVFEPTEYSEILALAAVLLLSLGLGKIAHSADRVVTQWFEGDGEDFYFGTSTSERLFHSYVSAVCAVLTMGMVRPRNLSTPITRMAETK